MGLVIKTSANKGIGFARLVPQASAWRFKPTSYFLLNVQMATLCGVMKKDTVMDVGKENKLATKLFPEFEKSGDKNNLGKLHIF
jgi:hypothetical protein